MKFTEKYPNESIRALSWKQPFASLMLHGKVETRVWDSKYTGLVLICASKAPYRPTQLLKITGKNQGLRIQNILFNKGNELCGKAIAIGRLVNSVRSRDYIRKVNENEPRIENIGEIERITFVNYHPELWLHHYEDVQPIVPFDWEGKLGWKTLNEEEMSKIILL